MGDPVTMKREVSFPKLRADATVEPTSLNEEARTVDVSFYTGAQVMRYSWEGPWKLQFKMDTSAVKLGRLNAGAPLLNSHSQWDLSSQIGVVEKAWIENGIGRATVRFSERADVEPIFQDVKNRIIRNVSMGAVIHELEDVTPKKAEMKEFLATSWEPMEISLVSVPADAGAQTMAAPETFRCELTYQEDTMSDQSKPVEKTPEVPAPVDLAAAQKAAAEGERARISEITRACTVAKLGADVAQKLIADGVDLPKAQSEIFRLMAERDEAQPIRSTITVGAEYDAAELKIEPMAIALAHRGGAKIDLTDHAKEYRGATMIDLAAALLSARGVRFSRFDRATIARLALSSSDFPNLLANVANKFLLPQYEAAQPTYLRVCAKQDLPDFKTASFLKTGDFPAPLEVPEGGAIQYGFFSESKDTGALASYGRRLGFTRQMLINDDTGALTRVMGSWGVRIRDFENAVFFALLSTVGPTLGDTGAMFNATAVTTAGGHANYTASGTAISDVNITVGATQMANQVGGGSTNLGDGIKLNIQPRLLLANPSKRLLAYQYTSPNYVPAAATSQNPWAGVLEPLLDANVSGNRWWLFADPAIGSNFV